VADATERRKRMERKGEEEAAETKHTAFVKV
jgi:hypothetical protein